MRRPPPPRPCAPRRGCTASSAAKPDTEGLHSGPKALGDGDGAAEARSRLRRTRPLGGCQVIKRSLSAMAAFAPPIHGPIHGVFRKKHGMDRPIHGVLMRNEGLFSAKNEPLSNVFAPFCRIRAHRRGGARRAFGAKERGRGRPLGRKPRENEGKTRPCAKKT